MSSSAPKLTKLIKLEVGGETTFGTEAAAADLKYVECISIDRSGLTRESIEHESQKQTFYENARIVGVANGQVVTEHYLHGLTDTLVTTGPVHLTPDDDNATGHDMLMAALAAALGDIYTATAMYEGSAVVSFSGGELTNTDAGGGLGDFVEGAAIIWATGATPAYEMGWLTEIDEAADPDTGGLLQTPVNNPQGTILWGAYNIFMKHGRPYMDGTPASFTLIITGEDTDDETTCLGCTPSGVTMEIANNMPPKVTITWAVASWSEVGVGDSPSTHSGLTVGSYDFAQPAAMTSALCQWGTGGAHRIVTDLKIDFGLAVSPLLDNSKANGIGGWYTTEIRPTVTFNVYRDGSEEVQKFVDQTVDQPFSFQWGDQPGNMMGFCIPHPFVEQYPVWQDGDGAVTAPVTLVAGFYNADSDETPDSYSVTAGQPKDTFFRLAFT